MAAVVSTQDLIARLAERHEEDADDLQAALQELQRQKLGTCDRLSRLNDGQWQRLGLPLGIEALIREEVAAAVAATASPPAHVAVNDADLNVPQRRRAVRAAMPQPAATHVVQHSHPAAMYEPLDDDDDDSLPLVPVEMDGLRRRGAGSSRRSAGGGSSSSRQRKGLLSDVDLLPPPDLELKWTQLLEDTLPPDKRPSLQATWDSASSEQDRYMIFLEYTSYLRKPELSEEELAERRKQLEPLMRELGVREGLDVESQSAIVWWLLIGFVIFVAGTVYYMYTSPEPAHDLQGL